MIKSALDTIGLGLSLIQRLFPDKKSRDEATLKLLDLEQSGALKEMATRANIIITEAQSGSWLASNWRPMLMVLFGIIIANNYVLAPYLHGFGLPSVSVPIPPDMWQLLKLGVGGYIVGRSVEKGIKSWKAK